VTEIVTSLTVLERIEESLGQQAADLRVDHSNEFSDILRAGRLLMNILRSTSSPTACLISSAFDHGN